MGLAECPVCGGAEFRIVAPIDQVRSEIRMRRDFVFARLGRRASRPELKDLTDFMHGFAAPVFECAHCGLLQRGEQKVAEAHSYEEDPNDSDLMAQVYPRYVEAFRNKRAAYEPLLRPRADVLELGSHLGAFLQTAEEWNWNPVGLDIGKDTAAFAQSRGFRVYRNVMEDAPVPDHTYEAVFIWNCFEQLPDPSATLAGAHRVLKPHGLLVVRVPNAFFYRAMYRATHALAYNNLLGFPYLYGYTAESLNRLVCRFGFQPVRGFNSELVTMPFADQTDAVRSEQMAVSRAVGSWTRRLRNALTAPWVELVYRKDGPRGRPKVDGRFLARAA